MKLSFTNFRSFAGGPHVFEFQPGTLFVVGDNKDEGFDSNGSGKTTLAALLPYALYGQIATGADKDDIVTYGARECCVELFLPGFQLRRVKSRKQAETLEWYADDIGGWIRGDLPDVQARLIKWLGISRKTFFNSYWIDRESKTVQFLFAKPSERQKILEELIDQDYFAEAKIRATKMRQVEEQRLEKFRNRILSFHNERTILLQAQATAREDLERIQRRAEAAKEAHEAEVARKHQAVIKTQALLRRAVLRKDRLKARVYDINSQKLRDMIADLNAKIKHNEGILYKEIENVALCDACGQTLPRSVYEKQRKERSDAAAFLQNRKGELAKMKDALAKVVAFEQEIQDLEAAIFADKQRLREQEIALAEANAKAPNPVEDTALMESRIEGYDKQIAEVDQKTIEVEIKRDAVSADIPRIRFFEDAFGSRGIPNLLLDDVRSLMTQFTQQYTEGLSKGQVSVTYPANDKGFEIEMTYKGQQADISTFSRGEAWRACLSVLLALRRTIAYLHKCGLDFLVMDDPFGDLDESGEVAVVDLANQLSNEVKYVIVTAPRHVSGAKAVQMTRVEKRNGVSRIL